MVFVMAQKAILYLVPNVRRPTFLNTKKACMAAAYEDQNRFLTELTIQNHGSNFSGFLGIGVGKACT